MRTFLGTNLILRRRKKARAPLPLWFTLNDVSKLLGVHRNSAKWYVTSGRIRAAARTAGGLDLFTEVDVTRFIGWRKTRRSASR